MKIYDTIVIGGGQAGLSVGYFLRRKKLDYLILDDQEKPGGSWLHTWESLRLFSPVQFSSLSGWMMPRGKEEYPGRDEFLDYITAYEKRYGFPVERPVRVQQVTKEGELFKVTSDKGHFYAKTLVSATGTAQNPFVQSYPEQDLFEGRQLHSAQYVNPKEFEGKRVMIVGGGNSGAQILAEVSKVAHTQWVTLEPPSFLPDEVDGRYLFERATQRFLEKDIAEKSYSLGDIVRLESVKEAESRGVLTARRPFTAFYKDGVIWEDGQQEAFDAVIWCTGFKSNVKHLDALNLKENNRIKTKYTRSLKEPNVWLVGYGNWTGFASATIYGVGKTARDTVNQISETITQLNAKSTASDI